MLNRFSYQLSFVASRAQYIVLRVCNIACASVYLHLNVMQWFTEIAGCTRNNDQLRPNVFVISLLRARVAAFVYLFVASECV